MTVARSDRAALIAAGATLVEIEGTTVVAPVSFLSSHLGVSGGPTLMVLVRAAVLK